MTPEVNLIGDMAVKALTKGVPDPITKCYTFNCDCPGGSASPESWKWTFGILCAIAGSVGSAMGLVLMKLAQNENDRLPEGKKRPTWGGMLCTTPRWLVGVVLLVGFPTPLALASVALAPQSVVEPLSAVTVVFGQVFAPLILGEVMTCRDWVATFVIFAGCILSAVMGDQCSNTFTIAEIKELFIGTRFLVFEGLIAVIIISCYSFLASSKQIPCIKNAEDPLKAEPVWTAMSHALLAGTLAGQQNILFKAIGEAFGHAFGGNSAVWSDWFFYVCLVVTLAVAILQMVHLNMGMKLMEAVKYLPVYNASLIINSTISGLIFYKEYHQITYLGIAMSAVCWVVIVLGVLMLAHGASEDSEHERQLKRYLPDGMPNVGRRQPAEEEALAQLHATGQLCDEKDSLLGR